MSLKPEISLTVGLATATVVYGVYSQATPTVADIRAVPQHDDNIESSRKLAAWTAAAVVAGVSLIAKDPTVFVVGGAMVIGMDWWTRHANAVNPMTGRASTAPANMAPTGSDVTVEYAPSAGTY